MVRMLIFAGLMLLLALGLPVPALAMNVTPWPQPVLAQAPSTDWSSTDIASFANAYQSVQSIKQDAEAEMVEAVQAEGLTVEQFNRLVDSNLNSEPGAAGSAAAAETAQFDAAVESIIAIRQAAEVEMQTAIEEEGLSVDTFNQIIDQAATDTELHEQISKALSL